MTKGFTAIELMMAIMVLLILAAAALPSMGSAGAEKKVQSVASEISVYMEKLRICGTASSYNGSKLVFDNRNDPQTMYGVCNSYDGLSKLSLYTPFSYDPTDALNPSGIKISSYSDVYIKIFNTNSQEMIFPRTGVLSKELTGRIITVSNSSDPGTSSYCCKLTLNSLGVSTVECTGSGCRI